ncbi:MAG TPA: hypothetical protein VG096_22870 [Bryobacteraceae bacterium]|jgi:hypothetical protein|nr:hypothetical protein [Bryobacteraceae bacterium]
MFLHSNRIRKPFGGPSEMVRIPVAGDDLDLAHAQLPARMHVTAWRR